MDISLSLYAENVTAGAIVLYRGSLQYIVLLALTALYILLLMVQYCMLA